MKTRRVMILIGFAIALMIVPVVNAQQGPFNAEIGNGQWSAVQPPLSGSYGDRGYFNPEIGSVRAPEEFSRSLETDNAADAAEGKFVEMSQIVEDDYVPEGQSVYVLVTRRLPASADTREIALRGR